VIVLVIVTVRVVAVVVLGVVRVVARSGFLGWRVAEVIAVRSIPLFLGWRIEVIAVRSIIVGVAVWVVARP